MERIETGRLRASSPEMAALIREEVAAANKGVRTRSGVAREYGLPFVWLERIARHRGYAPIYEGEHKGKCVEVKEEKRSRRKENWEIKREVCVDVYVGIGEEGIEQRVREVLEKSGMEVVI